jgi:hypothetical protein
MLTLTSGSFAQEVSDADNTIEVAIKIVRFFPNPASSVINFEFNSTDKSYTLQIYNFLGKKMSEEQINNNKLTYNLDNYYRGLYIFQVRNKGGNIIESGKFQVIK